MQYIVCRIEQHSKTKVPQLGVNKVLVNYLIAALKYG